MLKTGSYILSIDAGTTGITILAISHDGGIIQKVYNEITQHYPKPGWVEHDPNEIWQVTRNLMGDLFRKLDVNLCQALGITNQRETTVLWDKFTGKPIHPAIVWQCRRTADLCESLKHQGLEKVVHEKTGLYLDSYFSATKAQWILDHVDRARSMTESNSLAFGTIDTWLIYQLTGKKAHVTDHTNASRTLLYNIHTFDWDDDLLQVFQVSRTMLPEIHRSSDNFGETDPSLFDRSIPITGVAGD
ncbi:MAG: FGGY family carbohydrate kinase, partial [Fidelibacterota bacterium]